MKEVIIITLAKILDGRWSSCITMDQIAEEAGTTRQNILHHFSTKKNLFEETVRWLEEYNEDHLAHLRLHENHAINDSLLWIKE